ncbi:MAG: hypothetical protein WC584_03080 [Candidatus Pacearchaeota archaeon]
MAKKKEPNYLLWYIISVTVTLILHYFLLNSSNLMPIIQVAISFAIFTVIMGIIISVVEKKK